MFLCVAIKVAAITGFTACIIVSGKTTIGYDRPCAPRPLTPKHINSRQHHDIYAAGAPIQ